MRSFTEYLTEAPKGWNTFPYEPKGMAFSKTGDDFEYVMWKPTRDMSRTYATQPPTFIEEPKVKRLMKNIDKWNHVAVPEVVEKNGKLFIQDGHHRMTAAARADKAILIALIRK